VILTGVVVVVNSGDGGKEVDAGKASGEVSVDGEKLAIYESLD
jgi:hypothetical protein